MWLVARGAIAQETPSQAPMGATGSTPEPPDGSVQEAEWSGLYHKGGTECIAEEATPITGATVYVSPAGSDENVGNDVSAPLKSITKAICNASPGQTIKIGPGAYMESVIIYAFGNDSAPITISGDTSAGSRPVMDGNGSLTMGIAVAESNNIVIANLEFRNFTDEGVYVVSGSSFTLSNCEIKNNGFASIDPDFQGEGFGIQVSDTRSIVIENSSFTGNGPGPDRRAKTIMGTGIDTFAVNGGVIRGNISSGNIGGGVLVEDGTNIVVENNTIEGNDLDASADGWWDAGVWIDGGTNITVRNNVIRNNFGPAIEVSDEGAQYPSSSYGYLVENNEITGNYWAIYTYNFGVCPYPAAPILNFSGNVIENNTFAGSLPAEYLIFEEEQALCSLWPCGENNACD